MCLKNIYFNYLNIFPDIFDNLKFQQTRKDANFRPPNSYILYWHSKYDLFTLYLKGNGMKYFEFGKSWNLYMYTVGPQCKIFSYGLQCELIGAKWLHSIRNHVLQNDLVQFLKYLADHFDNLNFHETRQIAIFRPLNSFILHWHGKCGLFTSLWKEMV